MLTRREFLKFAAAFGAGVVLPVGKVNRVLASFQVPQVPIAGKSIPKYVEPLPIPNRISGTAPITIRMSEFNQQVLPAGFPSTTVWGYNGTYPGPTIEALRDTPLQVTYINDLFNPANPSQPPVLQKYLTIDQTLHWADPLMQMGSRNPYAGSAPAVVHLHGGEVPSQFDGGPDSWFTPGADMKGQAYSTNVYQYYNYQEGAILWYHDHTLGATRLNVYAGLAGFYLLRDPSVEGPLNLPGADQRNYEIEIVIQDRRFDTAGQLFFPDVGINPEHPYWIPEFFGDTIVVNGKPWPYLNVEPRRYRFRLLNGSNARFYNLQLFDTNSLPGPAFWQIGTDGGLLDNPVKLNDPTNPASPRLLMAPGERADIIIDFSGYAGKTFILDNNAKAPFPQGGPADPKTTGQIMQFRVGTTVSVPDQSYNPAIIPTPRLRPTGYSIVRLVPTITPATKVRHLTLNEIMGMGGPLEILLNNTKWDAPVSENPQVGSTEVWEIINLTKDAHPMHLHLVQFQLLSRQDFQTNKYLSAYNVAFPGGAFTPAFGPPKGINSVNPLFPGGNPDVTPFLQKTPTPPNPNENGWKDTVVMYPGQVSRIAIRFAPTDVPAGTVTPGQNTYGFDPTSGPGYVWHCHIIDHEDNEMMRPYKVQA
jgi:spore coat protein A, manganese oxidase